MGIRIHQFQEARASFDSGGGRLGNFALDVGKGMLVRGFSVNYRDDGEYWIGPPQRPYQKEGKTEYFKIFTLDAPDKDAYRQRWGDFTKWCIAELVRGNHIPKEPPVGAPPGPSDSYNPDDDIPF